MPVVRALPSTVTVPRPGRYRIDPDHSTIAVRTAHLFGLGTVHATFAIRRGETTVAERAESSRVEAVAGAASFDSHSSGRDKRVRSKALLDAGTHPEISFVSDLVSQAGGVWTVRGTLTVRGKDAPCIFTITDSVEGPSGLTVTATGVVDRYAHGVTGLRGFIRRYAEVTITAVLRSGG